jgi:hypothetical protein
VTKVLDRVVTVADRAAPGEGPERAVRAGGAKGGSNGGSAQSRRAGDEPRPGGPQRTRGPDRHGETCGKTPLARPPLGVTAGGASEVDAIRLKGQDAAQEAPKGWWHSNRRWGWPVEANEKTQARTRIGLSTPTLSAFRIPEALGGESHDAPTLFGSTCRTQ